MKKVLQSIVFKRLSGTVSFPLYFMFLGSHLVFTIYRFEAPKTS